MWPSMVNHGLLRVLYEKIDCHKGLAWKIDPSNAVISFPVNAMVIVCPVCMKSYRSRSHNYNHRTIHSGLLSSNSNHKSRKWTQIFQNNDTYFYQNNYDRISKVHNFIFCLGSIFQSSNVEDNGLCHLINDTSNISNMIMVFSSQFWKTWEFQNRSRVDAILSIIGVSDKMSFQFQIALNAEKCTPGKQPQRVKIQEDQNIQQSDLFWEFPHALCSWPRQQVYIENFWRLAWVEIQSLTWWNNVRCMGEFALWLKKKDNHGLFLTPWTLTQDALVMDVTKILREYFHQFKDEVDTNVLNNTTSTAMSKLKGGNENSADSPLPC